MDKEIKRYKVYRFIGDFVTSDYDIADANQKASAKYGDCIIEYVEKKSREPENQSTIIPAKVLKKIDRWSASQGRIRPSKK